MLCQITLTFFDDDDLAHFLAENRHRMHQAGFAHCTVTDWRIGQDAKRFDLKCMFVGECEAADQDHIDWAKFDPAPGWKI